MSTKKGCFNFLSSCYNKKDVVVPQKIIIKGDFQIIINNEKLSSDKNQTVEICGSNIITNLPVSNETIHIEIVKENLPGSICDPQISSNISIFEPFHSLFERASIKRFPKSDPLGEDSSESDKQETVQIIKDSDKVVDETTKVVDDSDIIIETITNSVPIVENYIILVEHTTNSLNVVDEPIITVTVVDETTKVVDETTKVVDETTKVVDETTKVVDETTSIVENIIESIQIVEDIIQAIPEQITVSVPEVKNISKTNSPKIIMEVKKINEDLDFNKTFQENIYVEESFSSTESIPVIESIPVVESKPVTKVKKAPTKAPTKTPTKIPKKTIKKTEN